jgi:hypothetical protein
LSLCLPSPVAPPKPHRTTTSRLGPPRPLVSPIGTKSSTAADIDLGERRDFQLVVRNRDLFGDLDRFPFRQLKNDSERIYRGQAIDGRGVFDSRAFTGFFANDVVGGPTGLPGYVVRANVDEGTVRFIAVDLRSCSGHLRNNHLDKECTVVGEVALRGCNLLDIPD